jgi:ATP phosphoribosyltransferase regulatory subunit HisZ
LGDANVQIPASAFESLALVLDLSDEEFAGLLSALGDPDATDLDDVTRALASASSTSSVEAADLVQSFVALNHLSAAHGLPAAEAAERIAH